MQTIPTEVPNGTSSDRGIGLHNETEVAQHNEIVQADDEVEDVACQAEEIDLEEVEQETGEKAKDIWAVDLEEGLDYVKPPPPKGCNPILWSLFNVFWRVSALLALLYAFIISLSLLGDSIAVLGGNAAGRTFRNAVVLQNPLGALCLGILVTVLVQSSSTSTSIIITMVAEQLITLKQGIPIIMGANIGTSVTNTIVSWAYIKDGTNYRRAFAGATVHDCFNILTALVLFIVELASGYLKKMCSAIVRSMGLNPDAEGSGKKVELLKAITSPVTKNLLSPNKKLISKIAAAKTDAELEKLMGKSIVKYSLFGTGLADAATGGIWLAISLILLFVLLYLIVKLLSTSLKGQLGVFIKKMINKDIRPPCGWTHGYILILIGAGCTVLVQSSSIFTSSLTPLIAMGLVGLDKALALTIGSNIGTTITGILAALASSNVGTALTLALAHTFFNITGIVIWWPIPFLRRVPLTMAKWLGVFAENQRWFPLAYAIGGFIVFPGLVVGLASLGPTIFLAIFIPLLCVAIILPIVFFFLRRRWRQKGLLKEQLKKSPSVGGTSIHQPGTAGTDTKRAPPFLEAETTPPSQEAAPVERRRTGELRVSLGGSSISSESQPNHLPNNSSLTRPHSQDSVTETPVVPVRMGEGGISS